MPSGLGKDIKCPRQCTHFSYPPAWHFLYIGGGPKESALGFKADIFGRIWVCENMSLHHLKRRVSCLFFCPFQEEKNLFLRSSWCGQSSGRQQCCIWLQQLDLGWPRHANYIYSTPLFSWLWWEKQRLSQWAEHGSSLQQCLFWPHSQAPMVGFPWWAECHSWLQGFSLAPVCLQQNGNICRRSNPTELYLLCPL